MRFIITIAIVFISFALSNTLFAGHTDSLEKRSPTGADLLIALKTGSRTNANSHQLLPDELEAVNAMIQVAQKAAFNYISPTTNIPTVLPNEPVLLLERIPKYVLTDRMLPFLNFNDAINLKGMKEFDLSGTNSAINTLNFREKQIIQHYSSTEPEAVVQYIFRDLDSPSILDECRLEQLNLFLSNPSVQRKIEEERQDYLMSLSPDSLFWSLQQGIKGIVWRGKLDLIKNILQHHELILHDIRLNHRDILIAAENGQKDIVLWILESVKSLPFFTPFYSHYKNMAVVGSVNGKHLEIFKLVVDKGVADVRDLKFLGYALQNALNLISFADYVFEKIRDLFDEKERSSWLREFVNTCIKSKKGDMTVNALDYLMNQPEWKPQGIRSILAIMANAKNSVLERLGRELLNPRLKFTIKPNSGKRKTMKVSGVQVLDAAIHIVGLYVSPKYAKVKKTLEKIRIEELRSMYNHNNMEATRRKRQKMNPETDFSRNRMREKSTLKLIMI